MHRQGFSLVELSIVLVILGLLTGGILTGQNLIRAAELRSVTTEFQAYQTAVMTFRDRYFALPGDMRNATDFWGAAHSTPATCRITASTDQRTCNGDGDGRVHTVDSGTTYHEYFRFWQHLANAGLIEGSYSGIADVESPARNTAGYNAPISKISNATWAYLWRGDYMDSDTNWFPGFYGNHFQFGGHLPTQASWGNILTPEEAWNVDSKIDDGRPGTGRVRPPEFNVNVEHQCIDSRDPATSKYILSRSELSCALIFITN